MDVKIINSFLAGASRVLTAMVMIEPVPGKPCINEDQYAKGIVSAIIWTERINQISFLGQTALEAPFGTL